MTETDRRSDPIYVLSAAAEAVAGSPDLDGALGGLLGTVAEAVGASAAVIYLQDPDRTALEPFLAIGIREADLPRLGELGAGPDAVVDPAIRAATEDAVLTVADPAGLGAFGLASGCRSACFHPSVARRGGIDQPAGVLAVGWPDVHELSVVEEEILGAVSNLAAVAIDRARLASLVAERSEWYERLAHSDPLTGLANQRTLARILELELARSERQGSEVGVILLDVDDFQALNEDHGRRVGDDVLRAVAGVLGSSVRLVDTVARHGGDEFVVVAPGSATMTVARRILAAVDALPPGDGGRISTSMGVARFPVDGASADDLLAAAGRALDDARATGRGTISEASRQRA